MRLRHTVRRLRDDARGATIIEFALVSPVMFLFTLGAFDYAHQLYTSAVLQGIVQKTARDSTLEVNAGANGQTALDESVKKQIRAMFNSANIDIDRRFYRTFADASSKKPEDYTDTNKDGQCNNNEPFVDANNNGVYDADGGNAGQGGAKDATIYTVSVNYPGMFPISRIVGISNTHTIKAETILRNQPYADQGKYAAAGVGNCT